MTVFAWQKLAKVSFTSFGLEEFTDSYVGISRLLETCRWWVYSCDFLKELVKTSMTHRKHPVITVLPFHRFLTFSFFLVMTEIAMLHSKEAHKLASIRSTSASRKHALSWMSWIHSLCLHFLIHQSKCMIAEHRTNHQDISVFSSDYDWLILYPQSAVHSPCNITQISAYL